MTRSTFEELLHIAREAGVQVRHAPLGGGGGGLVTLKGQRVLFVDTQAEPEDQLDRTLAAVAKLPQVAMRHVREDVRRLIQP